MGTGSMMASARMSGPVFATALPVTGSAITKTSLVHAGVFGSVFVSAGAARDGSIMTADVVPGGDGVSDILGRSGISQVRPVIVQEIVVQMSDLHVWRSDSDEGSGDEDVDVTVFPSNLGSESPSFGVVIDLEILRPPSTRTDQTGAIFVDQVSIEPRNRHRVTTHTIKNTEVAVCP